jgi:hypothetical protein
VKQPAEIKIGGGMEIKIDNNGGRTGGNTSTTTTTTTTQTGGQTGGKTTNITTGEIKIVRDIVQKPAEIKIGGGMEIKIDNNGGRTGGNTSTTTTTTTTQTGGQTGGKTTNVTTGEIKIGGGLEIKIDEKNEKDTYSGSTTTTTTTTGGNGKCTAYETNNSKAYCLSRNGQGKCIKKRNVYQTNKCLEWKNITKRVKIAGHYELNQGGIKKMIANNSQIVTKIQNKLVWCNKNKKIIKIQDKKKCGCQGIKDKAFIIEKRFGNWKNNFNAQVNLWKVKVEANTIQNKLAGIKIEVGICAKKIAKLAEERAYKLRIAAEKRALEIRANAERARLAMIANIEERKRQLAAAAAHLLS